jgi:DNA-binding MarR family transcriptional regulator
MGSHIKCRGSAREVLDSLRRIVQALRESSRRAERHLGISGAQLFVLETLAEAPSQSLNELAERTRTHQSSVSTVVGRLVERGLVARQRSGRDGRRLEVALTRRGRHMAVNTPGAVQARLIHAIETLRPASRRQLASLLLEVVSGMDALEQRPRMFFDEDRQRSAQTHV